jgi:hypothetical protein
MIKSSKGGRILRKRSGEAKDMKLAAAKVNSIVVLPEAIKMG